MNDQPNSQTTDIPSELRSNVLSDDNYSIVICDNSPEYPILGFLQLCADRRFHDCIQTHFRDDAKLDAPQKYWIHADAGGTPKMTAQTIAPNYCYHDKKVRLMGWSAHGNICGGFPPGTSDEAIEEALYDTIPDKIKAYPLATHFVYFARAIGIGAAEKSVLYSLKYEDGQITTRKG
jgi:hypothetical protein